MEDTEAEWGLEPPQRSSDLYDITFSELAWKDLWALPRETFLGALEQLHNIAEVVQRSSSDGLSRLSKMGGAWKSYISINSCWLLYTVDSKNRAIKVVAVTNQPHASDSGTDYP
jgi:hypothetical protein